MTLTLAFVALERPSFSTPTLSILFISVSASTSISSRFSKLSPSSSSTSPTATIIILKPSPCVRLLTEIAPSSFIESITKFLAFVSTALPVITLIHLSRKLNLYVSSTNFSFVERADCIHCFFNRLIVDMSKSKAIIFFL